MIVVDANVLAYIVVPSPHTGLALQAFRRDAEWAVPTLWRSELRNVLATGLRRALFPLADALGYFEQAEQLVAEEHAVATLAVLECAAATGCTAYDAEYAVLARELGVPLVTADRKLAEAVPETAVLLEEFVRSRR